MDTKIHMRLTIQSKAILMFLTTMAAEDTDKPAPMGSFVYSLPDVRPLPLALFQQVNTYVEFIEIQSESASLNHHLLRGSNAGVHNPSCEDIG
jgi:hypothetical protein